MTTNPEAVEDCFSERFPLTVINTASMKLETPVAAPPLAVVKATTPAIADYSPLKWKKSKKIYHTILAASFAFVV